MAGTTGTTSTRTLHSAPFNIVSKSFIILSYKQKTLFYISNHYKQCVFNMDQLLLYFQLLKLLSQKEILEIFLKVNVF